jgi:phosphoglucomutase
VARAVLSVLVGNGVRRVLVAANFLMSTPAVSALIRSEHATAGVILTASHNPGGAEGDLGIKFNMSNGGPAPEKVTEAVYKASLVVRELHLCEPSPRLDVTKLGVTRICDTDVEVLDSTAVYVALMRQLFDFDALGRFLRGARFTMRFDAMNGVAGPYARRIFVDELGLPLSVLLNCEPRPDFGGLHPDPNLTYAEEAVALAQLSRTGEPLPQRAGAPSPPDFVAACDGDADRNMILGARFFVTPSDSLAIIAANADCIPQFARAGGLKGVARSMPTSCAVDRVAAALKLRLFEVPTGWKFFGNLMDSGQLSLCGEESFGTGSDHIREKDGLWTVLAWLSIIAYKNRDRRPDEPLIGVRDIVISHWRRFGRNYYTRYDYEGVDSKAANALFERMLGAIAERKLQDAEGEGFRVKLADEFSYRDPVDQSVSQHQGVRVIYEDGSRFVFRLSGTGSVGATVRLYVERAESDPARLELLTAQVVAPLVQLALRFSNLAAILGRNEPTVIT